MRGNNEVQPEALSSTECFSVKGQSRPCKDRTSDKVRPDSVWWLAASF